MWNDFDDTLVRDLANADRREPHLVEERLTPDELRELEMWTLWSAAQ